MLSVCTSKLAAYFHNLSSFSLTHFLQVRLQEGTATSSSHMFLGNNCYVRITK